ncbi:hypothetical protein pipiens_009319 [Culex pipiens pipiens]|uniref:Uncharacterized protein n=1 Tax=Culex pipiens pipiens TaxID=38569 RepID=A0ABD1DEX9_CULPP
MDVSAHVRSKVLQIRHYIQGQNAVPLSSWQHQVLKGSVERLEDNSPWRNFAMKNGMEDGQLQEIRNKMFEQDPALKKTQQQWVYYMMFSKAYYVKTQHGPNLNEEFQKRKTRSTS